MLVQILLRRFAILRDSRFRALFVRNLCNRLVDGMIYVVTAWLLIKMTGKPSSVAIQLSLSLLPSALLSPIIGTVTDRLSRRNLVLIADLFQSVLVASTAMLLSFSVRSAAYLYMMTLAVGISGLLHQVAARALLRELVEKQKLLSASSTVSIANQVGGLFGPILGGIIAFQFGEICVLAFASAVALAGGLNLLVIPARRPQDRAARTGLLLEYVAGLRMLRSNRIIRRLFISCTFFYLSVPLLNFLLPLVTMKSFGLSVQSFGAIDAMFGIGGIAAGVFLHELEERFGHQPMIVGGVAAFGLAILLFPLNGSLIWLFPVYLLIGFTFHAGVALMSELQREVPQDMQGRILSMQSTSTAVLAVLLVQLLGSGTHGDASGIVLTYVVYGLLLIGFSLVFLRIWLKDADEDVAKTLA